MFGNSHRRCSVRKGVLRNFAKFTGKQLCQASFLIKLKNKLFYMCFFRFLFAKGKKPFYRLSQWLLPMEKKFKMLYFRTHLCGYFWILLNEMYLCYTWLLLHLLCPLSFCHLLRLEGVNLSKLLNTLNTCIELCMHELSSKQFFWDWFFIHKNLCAKYYFLALLHQS